MNSSNRTICRVRADRATVNAYLENFYNEIPQHNTYVPFTIWEQGKVRQLPEPAPRQVIGDISSVPEATREVVAAYLKDRAGVSTINDSDHLARDLGMDSLERMDLILWLEKEFGFTQPDVDSLQTVGDAMLAAAGEAVSSKLVELKPVPPKWFTRSSVTGRALISEAETITESFLKQARRGPDRPCVVDQIAGLKTYRQLITGIMVMKEEIEELPGDRVGIMLPASVVADVLYFACMFAGKTPVMVNWTQGTRNMVHLLDLVKCPKILTSQKLIDRLEAQGIDFTSVADRIVALEEVAKGIALTSKLKALAKSYLSWRSLDKAVPQEIAAILFTSGSEALPKAVPLTHRNILLNAIDVLKSVNIPENANMLGLLPPFHAFGLTITMVLPLCAGIGTVYYANPTEAVILARIIEAYRVSIFIGTPTFLNAIAQAATPEQLDTVKFAVTGAERCTERAYENISRKCRNAIYLEGYGITECSPIISANRVESRTPYTVGIPMDSMEYALVDIETNQRVSEGRQGMMLVRGPNVFDGYLGDEVESPFVEFEGKKWYRTGDLLKVENGLLVFCGRLKRFIKLGGEMISLPAIEAVLVDHWAALDDEGPVLAVLALGDTERPEMVLATTKPIDRETANRQIAEAGLSPLHNIRRVINVDEIPVLGTGKTNYRQLQDDLSA